MDPRRLSSIALSIVAVVLIAAAAVCVFEVESGHHHGATFELCTAMLAATVVSMLGAALGLVGMTAPAARWVATPAWVSIPHPPPWRVRSLVRTT